MTNVIAKAQGNVAVNPDTYLFWDDLHPTTSGHHLIALAAAALLAAPVTTTTAVSSSALNANLGTSVTFTATVAPNSGTVAPVGTVAFLDGTTVLSTIAITGTSTGSATYTTSALSAGTHTITASFTGVNSFSSSASAAITETVTAPAIQGALSPTSATVTGGASASTAITLTAVGGFTGSATLACGSLPVHFACSFSQTSVTLSGTPPTASSTLTVSTSLSSRLRLPLGRDSESRAGAVTFAFAPLGLGVALFGPAPEKGRQPSAGTAQIAHAASTGAADLRCRRGSQRLRGCGYRPHGTYTVPIMISASLLVALEGFCCRERPSDEQPPELR